MLLVLLQLWQKAKGKAHPTPGVDTPPAAAGREGLSGDWSCRIWNLRSSIPRAARKFLLCLLVPV
jgi:hypothetical protein